MLQKLQAYALWLRFLLVLRWTSLSFMLKISPGRPLIGRSRVMRHNIPSVSGLQLPNSVTMTRHHILEVFQCCAMILCRLRNVVLVSCLVQGWIVFVPTCWSASLGRGWSKCLADHGFFAPRPTHAASPGWCECTSAPHPTHSSTQGLVQGIQLTLVRHTSSNSQRR